MRKSNKRQRSDESDSSAKRTRQSDSALGMLLVAADQLSAPAAQASAGSGSGAGSASGSGSAVNVSAMALEKFKARKFIDDRVEHIVRMSSTFKHPDARKVLSLQYMLELLEVISTKERPVEILMAYSSRKNKLIHQCVLSGLNQIADPAQLGPRDIGTVASNCIRGLLLTALKINRSGEFYITYPTKEGKVLVNSTDVLVHYFQLVFFSFGDFAESKFLCSFFKRQLQYYSDPTRFWVPPKAEVAMQPPAELGALYEYLSKNRDLLCGTVSETIDKLKAVQHGDIRSVSQVIIDCFVGHGLTPHIDKLVELLVPITGNDFSIDAQPVAGAAAAAGSSA